MSDTQQDKIMFQYIMNYKAYRRKMISMRLTLTAIIAGGLLGLCAVSIVLGIVLGATAIFVGVLAVIFALGNEQTYTVYDTRIVLKKRGNDKRKIVPMQNIVGVAYKRAFYEKGLLTGTVTVTAKADNGKKRKYKLRHVFDAAPVVEYLRERVSLNKSEKIGDNANED